VVAADVNGDGKLDFIADGSCVYLGKLEIGDFNDDGKLDVVAHSSKNRTFLFLQK